MLELKKICFGYYDNVIFHDMNLNIEDADRIGIIGESGSGKSTLLRLILLLSFPTKGEIRYENQSIFSCKKKIDKSIVEKYRSKVGVVFQELNLWPHMTVLENVMLPLIIKRKYDLVLAKKLSNDMLDKVGLLEYALFYPKQLSVGMKQRCAIARTIIFNPEILLLDEITSSLDSANADSVLKLIVNIVEEFNLSLIIVSHDQHLIKNLCRKKYVIKGKRLSEE
jgi:D-methionine transport system ATP-binding protein